MIDVKLADDLIKQRSLMVACGEIAELLKDLCFAANAPFNEAKLQRIGGAAAGLDRATHRLRVAVLGQTDYPTFEQAGELRKEIAELKAQIAELLARYAPPKPEDVAAEVRDLPVPKGGL